VTLSHAAPHAPPHLPDPRGPTRRTVLDVRHVSHGGSDGSRCVARRAQAAQARSWSLEGRPGGRGARSHRSPVHTPHPTTGTSGHQPHTNVSTVTVGGPVPRRCRARPDVVNDARVGERSAGAAASSSRCGLRGGLTERKETDDQRRAQQEDGVFRVGPRVISG